MVKNKTLRLGALRLHTAVTGRHILERLNDLNQTQWLSYEDLMKLQHDKLLRLLEYAYQNVPYYRRTFDAAGLHPNDLRQDLAGLNQLPVLTKTMVQEHWNEMLTTEPERRNSLSKASTSGSTGQPLVFMQDADFRDSVTADIQRHMGWAGWKLGESQAVIWGAPFTSSLSRRVRTQLIDMVWNRIQINAFTMTEQAMANFAEQVRRWKPRILFGYASSVQRFAQFVKNSPYRGLTFDAVFTGAELLLPAVRDYLKETFECQVFNHYGTNELGGMACECEAHTGLHISVENSYVEILKEGCPAKPGEVGDLIITNLNNRGMPFIRYSIGDGGAWYAGDACPCGRALPRLSSIDGRKADAFQTLDGRSIWTGFTGAAFRCLAHPAIRQFQVVQKSLDHIIVRLVKMGELPPGILEEITQTMQAAFGTGVVINFEYPTEIPALPSGKHQYAISEISHF
ncbi:MAG TPA: AMP-binding protein [Anaerolineales bacterium]|nr:AMP-binding protein [Anaerolineales bacterium]